MLMMRTSWMLMLGQHPSRKVAVLSDSPYSPATPQYVVITCLDITVLRTEGMSAKIVKRVLQ
jgi:hypothetical protein